MTYKRAILRLIVVIAFAILLAVPAIAQYHLYEPPDPMHPNPDNPPYVITLSNKYVEFEFGVWGEMISDIDGEVFQVGGRYGISNRVGDPETTDDDNQWLVWRPPVICGHWNYSRVKIGDNSPLVVGDPTMGSWTKYPRVYDVPMSGYGRGIGGPYIEGDWTDSSGTVTVRVHISLVRDQVRFEYTVTNASLQLVKAGISLYLDAVVEDTDKAGYPFVTGSGLARTPGLPDQFAGNTFAGSKIPSMFEIYDSVDSPVTRTRITLREQDCTSPDFIAIGELDNLATLSTWLTDPADNLPNNYVPDPMVPIDDLAYMVEWKQVALASHISRTYVTYFGNAVATTLWTYRSGTKIRQDSIAAAVQGPNSLQYDSTTGVTQMMPSPFTIKAYLYNTDTDPGPYDLQNVTAYLYLPKGLQLAEGTNSTSIQEIGNVPINSESTPVEWQVEANGEAAGELVYYVLFRDTSGWQQIVGRKIIVPAAKKAAMRYGYQLMSVPFTFNNPSISHVFGINAGYYSALYYDSSGTQNYVPITQFESGKAFWMAVYSLSMGSSKTYDIATDAAIVGEEYGKQSIQQTTNLVTGWNMVGNPLVYPIYIGQLQVYNSATNLTVSFDQAVAQGLVSRTVFAWNSDRSAYDSLSTNDTLLVPWRGYWFRAKTPVTLVFRPAIFPGSAVNSLPGGY
ncbi:MAG: hypothetical protein ABFD54_11885 [Armatimonadota bacterium]|nr:hypothetical protein [bacterium]